MRVHLFLIFTFFICNGCSQNNNDSISSDRNKLKIKGSVILKVDSLFSKKKEESNYKYDGSEFTYFNDDGNILLKYEKDTDDSINESERFFYTNKVLNQKVEYGSFFGRKEFQNLPEDFKWKFEWPYRFHSTDYIYDINGNCIQELSSYGNYHKFYDYDEKNKLIKRYDLNLNDDKNAYLLTETEEYFYNGISNLLDSSYKYQYASNDYINEKKIILTEKIYYDKSGDIYRKQTKYNDTKYFTGKLTDEVEIEEYEITQKNSSERIINFKNYNKTTGEKYADVDRHCTYDNKGNCIEDKSIDKQKANIKIVRSSYYFEKSEIAPFQNDIEHLFNNINIPGQKSMNYLMNRNKSNNKVYNNQNDIDYINNVDKSRTVTIDPPSETKNSGTPNSNKSKCTFCNGTGKCSKCMRVFQVQFWDNNGWKNRNETRPGQIMCNDCRGAGVIYGSKIFGQAPESKKCYVTGCNNGWQTCQECNYDGRGSKLGQCTNCKGEGYR
jgi:hypothetical protein